MDDKKTAQWRGERQFPVKLIRKNPGDEQLRGNLVAHFLPLFLLFLLYVITFSYIPLFFFFLFLGGCIFRSPSQRPLSWPHKAKVDDDDAKVSLLLAIEVGQCSMLLISSFFSVDIAQ
jgi:hypothetical protein